MGIVIDHRHFPTAWGVTKKDAEQKAKVVFSLAKKAGKIRGLESVYWYAADWDPSFDVHNEGWFRKGIAEAYLRQRG